MLKADTSAECGEWIECLRLSQFHVMQSSLSIHENHLNATQGHASILEASRDEAMSVAGALRHQLAAAEAQNAAVQQMAQVAMAEMEREKAALEASLDQAQREREMLLAARGIRTARPRSHGEDSNAAKLQAEQPLRMWVGTWNVGASEPFESGSGSAMRLLQASFLKEELPADLYLLGMQEGISESVFSATEALTGTVAGCVRIPLGEVVASEKGDGRGGGEGSEKGAWTDKIHGRGDGSLMGTKFTGLALFVNHRVRAKVRVLGCVAHSLEKLGSKGGVAVALNVDGTTVVFVTCHLEAAKRDIRRAQVKELIRELGDKLGLKGFDLTSQFHHVVWCGDLNYRCVETNGEVMPAERCAAMLRAGQNGTLFQDHDQLNQERRQGEVFANFREAVPHPEFYPTYKKLENRASPTNYEGDWVSAVYRIRYKEPIYKGGNVKERTPGYTDRILFHSLSDMESTLVPERKSVPLELIGANDSSNDDSSSSSSRGAPPHEVTASCDNYCSVNDGAAMSVSDHSPVYGTFLLSTQRQRQAFIAKKSHSATAPITGDASSSKVAEESVLDSPTAQVEVIALKLKGSVEMTSFDVVFPSPYEAQDGFAHCHCPLQGNGWREEPMKPKTDCRHFVIDQGTEE